MRKGRKEEEDVRDLLGVNLIAGKKANIWLIKSFSVELPK